MSSIASTGIGVVSVIRTGLLLFYQDNDGNIREAHFENNEWVVSPTPVAEDARGDGAPLTVYTIDRDADHGYIRSVHVLFFNTASQLAERVKVFPYGTWQSVSPDGIPSDQMPDTNSRLTGFSYNEVGWHHHGSQWVYYLTSKGSKTHITEIRRSPRSPWTIETILPQSSALPGTKLCGYLAEDHIELYLQDHAKDIRYWKNHEDVWQDLGVFIDHDKVAVNTPISVFYQENKRHVLCVNNADPMMIQDYIFGNSEPVSVEKFYPGSNFTTVILEDQPTLFYKSLNPVGAIATKVFKEGKWEDGSVVIE